MRLFDILKQKGGEAELKEICIDPVKWGEVFLINRDGSQRRYWDHQKEDLRCTDTNIIHLDGRDVGKTIVLVTSALHFAFTNKGGQGLIAAPQQGHLDAVIEEIEFQIDQNPDIADAVGINKNGKSKIVRKPYFRIEFLNGAILYLRPAGAYGDSFRSLHVDRVWVDEAARLSEKSWVALLQCLKKTGGHLRIYSTPTGVRDTTYYKFTFSDQFTQFRWPSWFNPAWDKEIEAKYLEYYGGKDSSGWQHEIAGEHGKPAYGAFNSDQFNLCCQNILEYRKIFITGSELKNCEDEEQIHDRLEMLLGLMPQTGVFWVGGDLGYTNDPTELVVFKEEQVGEKRVLSLVLRVQMRHVSYPNISQTIGLLDRYFSPTGIGVDNGGNGLAVVQELLSLDRYRDLCLDGRLEGFNFGGVSRMITPDGREIKKRTKELMTSLIAGALQRREIIFPSEDAEIRDEFVDHTYTLRDGKVIYSKGNDHVIDAVRCAVLVREQERMGEIGMKSNMLVKPILTAPVFV